MSTGPYNHVSIPNASLYLPYISRCYFPFTLFLNASRSLLSVNYFTSVLYPPTSPWTVFLVSLLSPSTFYRLRHLTLFKLALSLRSPSSAVSYGWQPLFGMLLTFQRHFNSLKPLFVFRGSIRVYSPVLLLLLYFSSNLTILIQF